MPLYLTATNDILEVTTSSVADLDVVATVATEDPTATPRVTTGKQATAINSATTTTIVSAPAAAGKSKSVIEVNFRNKHATLSNSIVLINDIGGTNYELDGLTLEPGAAFGYTPGVGFFKRAAPPVPFPKRILSADALGQNVTTAQPWFPTNGAAAVQGATLYRMRGLLSLDRTVGTGSHTTNLLFGGTATLTNILWHAIVNTGDVESVIAAARTIARVATTVVVKATSNIATEKISMLVDGWVRVNIGGTFIPQFQYVGTAPGQTPTIKANSSFELEPVGTNTFTTQGTWT